MSASAVLRGIIVSDPEPKITGSGAPYVAATLRDTHHGNDVDWLLLAFTSDAQADLTPIRVDDEVEAAGELKVHHLVSAGRVKTALVVNIDRVNRVERISPPPQALEARTRRKPKQHAATQNLQGEASA